MDKQIEVINPSIIVPLGRFSMSRYLGKVKISKVHGSVNKVNGKLIFPMYHPSVVLHQPSLKKVVIDDFYQLTELISKIIFEAQSLDSIKDDDKDIDNSIDASPEQLRLF